MPTLNTQKVKSKQDEILELINAQVKDDTAFQPPERYDMLSLNREYGMLDESVTLLDLLDSEGHFVKNL